MLSVRPWDQKIFPQINPASGFLDELDFSTVIFLRTCLYGEGVYTSLNESFHKQVKSNWWELQHRMRTLFRRNHGIYSFLLERNVWRPSPNCSVLRGGSGGGNCCCSVTKSGPTSCTRGLQPTRPPCPPLGGNIKTAEHTILPKRRWRQREFSG